MSFGSSLLAPGMGAAAWTQCWWRSCGLAGLAFAARSTPCEHPI